MKRFLLTVLGAAVFFMGLGALVENVGARFKSDEKALELIKKARQALGGDAAISAVESMKIVGRSTHTFDTDGQTRSQVGEVEIALQLPNQLSRTFRFGNGEGPSKHEFHVRSIEGGPETTAFARGFSNGPGGLEAVIARSADGKIQGLDPAVRAEMLAKAHSATVIGPGETREFKIYRKDGESVSTPDGNAQIFLRRAETEAARAAGGERAHRIIVRKEDGTFHELNTDGGSTAIMTAPLAEMKARIAAESALAAAPIAVAGNRQNEMLRTTLALLLTAPKGVDVSYVFGGEAIIDGTPCNIVLATSGGSTYKIYLSQSTSLPVAMAFSAPRVFFRRDMIPSSDGSGIGRTTYKTDGVSTDEVMVKYSDYREVNGVQLPYRWTQINGGSLSEVLEVTSYEINPSDIGERFQNQRIFVRGNKDNGQ